ncbi:MAG TPA: DUF4159 domain-containing protein [Bryobacteraceae bacterium]|jgi:hypothetical protein
MKLPIYLAAGVLVFFGTLYAFQKPFKEFSGTEYYAGDIPLPADWKEPSDFVFARLMFPGGPLDGYYPRFQGNYHFGLSLWTQDYPRADRHFLEAVRRLTNINARSVEQVVDLEDGDEAFNWPFLYAVQAGEWGLTEKQGAILREFVNRGGFFIGDDFHGTDEFGEFDKRIHFAFPERPLVDMPDKDPFFHAVYDLDDRYRIPGQAHVPGGKNGGTVGHWMGMYDEKGRAGIIGWYNSDVGDSWEYADDPRYPEKYSALGIRLGVNAIIYAMTH